jgi:hypothetical protein
MPKKLLYLKKNNTYQYLIASLPQLTATVQCVLFYEATYLWKELCDHDCYKIANCVTVKQENTFTEMYMYV